MPRLSKEKRKKLEALESKDTKYCMGCKKVKPLYDFNFNAGGRKNAYAYCTKCNKRIRKESNILSKFGITLTDYDKMLKDQNGECAICGTKTPRGQGRFHIDHDHDTKKIRGLLCHSCNTALGLMKDNPEILIAAAHYLIDSRKQ